MPNRLQSEHPLFQGIDPTTVARVLREHDPEPEEITQQALYDALRFLNAEQLRVFLILCFLSLELHQRPKGLGDEAWVQNLMITLRYCLGTENAGEIGQLLEPKTLTKQTVSGKIHQTLGHLRGMLQGIATSSENTQLLKKLTALHLPPAGIHFDISKDTTRIRGEQVQQWIVEIKAMVTDPDQIWAELAELGVKKTEVYYLSSEMHQRGLPFPKIEEFGKHHHPNLAQRIQRMTTEDARVFLKTSDEITRAFYEQQRDIRAELESSNTPVILPLSAVYRQSCA